MNFLDKFFGRLGNRMFQSAYIYAQAKRGLIPEIYLQNEKYFKEFKEEIKVLFGTEHPPIDMVAIHVRRGDYVNNPFYVDLTETPYYEDAMLFFLDEKFLVFSDDIEWCKTQSMFKECEFSEGKTEEEDLRLMASCKGVIMANSSFSWWGAYLSKGKVVAPKNWYADGVERTACLKEWLRV